MGVNTFLLVGRLADDGEGTNTLAVQTHILREGLSQDRAETLLQEVTEREGGLFASVAVPK